MAAQVAVAFALGRLWKPILAGLVLVTVGAPLAIALGITVLFGALDDQDPDAEDAPAGLSVLVPADLVDVVTNAAAQCDGDPRALAATIVAFPGADADDSWPLDSVHEHLVSAELWGTYGINSDAEGIVRATGALWCDVVTGFGDWADNPDEVLLGAHIATWSAAINADNGVVQVTDAGHRKDWSTRFSDQADAWTIAANQMGLYLSDQQVIDKEQEATGPGVMADGTGRVSKSGSGRLDPATLCPILGQPTWLLRCDAAAALDKFNVAYKAKFGHGMTGCGPTCAYRDYAAQVRAKNEHGNMAATPGMSNHGWGLAIDFTPATHGSSTTGQEYVWMRANSRSFGWDHPSWARSTGSKPEIWHWEYIGPPSS